MESQFDGNMQTHFYVSMERTKVPNFYRVFLMEVWRKDISLALNQPFNILKIASKI